MVIGSAKVFRVFVQGEQFPLVKDLWVKFVLMEVMGEQSDTVEPITNEPQ
jgi:hypothetical protein